MNRLFIVLVIIVCTQISCENNASSTQEVKAITLEIIDSSIVLGTELVDDSLDSDTTQIIENVSKRKDTSNSVEKKDDTTQDKSVNIDDALDVNKYKSVRDDPDYIGTPCEYVNGECIRHDHNKSGSLPNHKGDDL